MNNKKLKERAKDFLSGGRYFKSLLYTLFVTLLSTNFLTTVVNDDNSAQYYIGLSLLTPVKEISAVTFQKLALIFIFIVLFIVPMFRVSLSKFFMRDYTDMEKFNSQRFLSVGSENYGNLIKIFLLRGIKIFLYTLLFIIPGLIKSYEYFLLPYILAEDPSMDSKEAFKMTKHLMDGNKMNILMLNLSFLGWILIGIFVPGSIFLIQPYMEATFTQAYLDIKDRKNVVIGKEESEEYII